MSGCDELSGVSLVVFIPYGLAALGVFIAVFAEAYRKCPYQPDEDKAFTRPTLPRTYSNIYVLKARRFTRHQCRPKSQL